MTSTLATRQVNIAGYNLSVTTRDNGDDPALLEELTFRTIGAFLYLAGLLEKGIYEAGVTGSVEARLAAEKGITFSEAFVDPRVTVWDGYRGTKNPSFHLNSDDEPQVAMNTYMANDNAIRRAIEKYGTPQNATQTAPATAQTRETSAPVMNTPKAQESGLNGVNRVNGKKSIKELPDKAWFYMPVAKISAVMSPDGKLKWELYGFYGSNPGKFADLVIYADNENSIKNGLNAALTAIVGKPGQSVTGKWFAKGKVIEKDDKKAIYTNLLFDEQETLLNKKPENASKGFDERDYYAGSYPDNEDEFQNAPIDADDM